MVTPTTKNPYLLYGAEPPNWHSFGNTEPWEDYKKRIQQQNELWWKAHTGDGNYPHTMETPLGVEGSDFPLGRDNRYGPFIYCPFPVEGIVRWAFRRADGYAMFRQDVENDTLPKGGSGTPKATVPSARSRAAAKPVEPAPEPTPAADIDLSGDLELTAAEPDPFADLDMGSEPTASAVESAPESDPFADLDMGAAEPESAAAEPAPAAEGEPEVDEWGEVIQKPKAASADPFEGLM
jgi:hypothetical protein